MSKDTCVHFISESAGCRAESPICSYHYDGACRAPEGKLEERAPASYGFRFYPRNSQGKTQHVES